MTTRQYVITVYLLKELKYKPEFGIHLLIFLWIAGKLNSSCKRQ